MEMGLLRRHLLSRWKVCPHCFSGQWLLTLPVRQYPVNQEPFAGETRLPDQDEMVFQCLACGADVLRQNLLIQPVFTYLVTESGQEMVLSGAVLSAFASDDVECRTFYADLVSVLTKPAAGDHSFLMVRVFDSSKKACLMLGRTRRTLCDALASLARTYAFDRSLVLHFHDRAESVQDSLPHIEALIRPCIAPEHGLELSIVSLDQMKDLINI